MPRVPARVVLALLVEEAERTGDARYRVSGAAIRNWVYRGHLTRGPGGYDLAEVLAYLDARFATAGRESFDTRSSDV